MQDYNNDGLIGRYGWLIDSIAVTNKFWSASINSKGNYCQAPTVWTTGIYLGSIGFNTQDSINIYVDFGDLTDTTFNVSPLSTPFVTLNHLYAVANQYLLTAIFNDGNGKSQTLSFNTVILNQCDSITGRIYFDQNTDCLFNNNDMPLEAMINIKSKNSTYYTYTDSSGYYAYYCPIDTYTVRTYWTQSSCFTNGLCVNGLDSIVVNTMPSNYNDFVADSVSPIQNLKIYAKMYKVSNGSVFARQYGYNQDCMNITGFIHVQFGSSADSIACNNNYYFNFGNSCVNPTTFQSKFSQTNYFEMAKKVNGYLPTDTICAEFRAEPVITDIDSTDNIVSICSAFQDLSPFDPNGKDVSPDGDIPNNTELTYEIHFQNTGTAPAINVVVVDTLSQNVDLNTFKILGSTHSMHVAIKNNREVQFMFPNINLPDSVADFNASMGSLMYSVKTIPGLVAGTQITNSCDIFFDQNAPVKTNTTVNTIILPNAIETVSQIKNSISVYPNPATDFINVKSNSMLMNQISLFDITGQLIYDEIISSSHALIDARKFSNGIYILRIKTESGFYFEKIVL